MFSVVELVFSVVELMFSVVEYRLQAGSGTFKLGGVTVVLSNAKPFLA